MDISIIESHALSAFEKGYPVEPVEYIKCFDWRGLIIGIVGFLIGDGLAYLWIRWWIKGLDFGLWYVNAIFPLAMMEGIFVAFCGIAALGNIGFINVPKNTRRECKNG